MGRVLPMVAVSIMPNAESGRNDHREDGPHFILQKYSIKIISVNKMDEVLGMLSFANDIVSHLSQVEVILKKEKKKRLRREQLQTDAEKLEVNRQLNILLFKSKGADKLSKHDSNIEGVSSPWVSFSLPFPDWSAETKRFIIQNIGQSGIE